MAFVLTDSIKAAQNLQKVRLQIFFKEHATEKRATLLIQQYLVLETKPQNMGNKNQIQENQVVYIPTETPHYTLNKTTLSLFPKHRSNAEIFICPEVGHLPIQELFFHQLGKS